PYRIAELNAGIGELRLALELKAACVSVLAAESSRLARRAYAERFGMSPLSIPSVSEAKRLLAHQTVDIVLAHLSDMPNARRRRLKCPPFSDSDILALIESSRPSAFLLAGAFRSVTSKSERRVRQLLRRLVMALNYQILGCSWNADAEPVFDLDALVCEENAGEKGGRRSLFLLGLDRERFGDGAEADAGTLPAVVLSGEDSANEEDSAARADDDNSSEGCAGPDEAGGYTAALNGEQRSTLKKRAHSLGVLLPLAMRIADILKAGAG
ncbi:hypothetical protein IJT17_01600, partial [bacterium]|nr:hypothetical protein [bacterium]